MLTPPPRSGPETRSLSEQPRRHNPAAAAAAACQVCGRHRRSLPLLPAALVRPRLAAEIAKAVPGWSEQGYICVDDLNRFRARFVETLLEQGVGEVTALEAETVERIHRQDTLATDVDAELDRGQTLGERVADRVADFGGSWTFILLFGGVIVCWMALNTFLLATRAFDPYPYILLNLVLSCLAAVQAPVIMMSQNRQESRDRARARNDYLVNLKAELEIRLLHDKLDHLLHHQWERLMEIQEIQVELMNELAQRRPGGAR